MSADTVPPPSANAAAPAASPAPISATVPGNGLQPLVGIIMGSQSDWTTMKHAADTLAALGVGHEVRIVSAHRTPHRLVEYATTAKARGLKVVIAGAGGAAHLPGMAASMTPLPVFGVPVESHALKGMDSLLSIVQMPGGVPVGTLAIGKAGAINAALLAASVIALLDPAVAGALDGWRARQTAAVAEAPVDDPA
ncbi:5-(carboxyamino)imidazole ribonucleotide mutase [Azospirillum picis]|uniref:N5-carboxyaminoimidazole ribonucleotide mutase n=2 Tax=Azospirillum picis TaxID=488438 RepID=A0ABU0MFS3_9PROT|nr:5-(carboxyamino)imidazole ribonucleotide mutase [Azospirillum picis]MDQ0532269.1 5-(carboxyamino)imidazole ribonucleotide mutase [Azospirillum picis]